MMEGMQKLRATSFRTPWVPRNSFIWMHESYSIVEEIRVTWALASWVEGSRQLKTMPKTMGNCSSFSWVIAPLFKEDCKVQQEVLRVWGGVVYNNGNLEKSSISLESCPFKTQNSELLIFCHGGRGIWPSGMVEVKVERWGGSAKAVSIAAELSRVAGLHKPNVLVHVTPVNEESIRQWAKFHYKVTWPLTRHSISLDINVLSLRTKWK